MGPENTVKILQNPSHKTQTRHKTANQKNRHRDKIELKSKMLMKKLEVSMETFNQTHNHNNKYTLNPTLNNKQNKNRHHNRSTRVKIEKALAETIKKKDEEVNITQLMNMDQHKHLTKLHTKRNSTK